MADLTIPCPHSTDGFITVGDQALAATLIPDHEFKSHPDVFWPAVRGEKTFEFRKDDRGGYHVGQTVRLRCYANGTYTGDAPLDRIITNILRPGEFGLQDGYCILSLAPISAALARPVAEEPGDAAPLGYYFHNPDSGWEISWNHPVESGECDDATEIEELTPARLKELLIKAWDDAEEARAERDEVSAAPKANGVGTGEEGVTERVSAEDDLLGHVRGDTVLRAVVAAKPEGEKASAGEEPVLTILEVSEAGGFHPRLPLGTGAATVRWNLSGEETVEYVSESAMALLDAASRPSAALTTTAGSGGREKTRPPNQPGSDKPCVFVGSTGYDVECKTCGRYTSDFERNDFDCPWENAPAALVDEEAGS